jgi:quercetin dioxygenase-like cupin family protein
MARRFNENSEPQKVLRRTLATLLRSFRQARNEPLETAATRLAAELKRDPESARYAKSQVRELFQKGGIDALEDAVDGAIEISYSDCDLLSYGYGVHPLLMDSLLSKSTNELVLLKPSENFFIVGEEGERSYGVKARYGVPVQSLEDASSVSIVHLRLDPKGFSDTHSHPGDELLLVLTGSAEVLLLDTGLRTRLNSGDYLHFYAEHEHFAINSETEPAEMLVVRFQHSRRRADLVKSLQASKSDPSDVQAVHREFLSVLAPQPYWNPSLPLSEDVVDRLNLGRFLQLACEPKVRLEGRLTLNELAKRGKPYGIGRSRIDRIHHGRSPVSQRDLVALAKIHELAPVLLCDFLCPALSGAIAVRTRPDSQIECLMDSDMRLIPEEFLPKSKAVYQIPCRRLANTDTAIATLRLPPGAKSPENRHPGHEILIPLKGEVRLRLANGNVDKPVAANRGEFAHFRSQRDHWVENSSDEDAEVLVLRIHE